MPFILTQIFWQDLKARLSPASLGLTALRVLITLFGSAFVTFTFTHLPLAQCYAIFFTMPHRLTVLAWPQPAEQIDLLRGLIILVGFGSVLISLQPGSTDFQLAHMTPFSAPSQGQSTRLSCARSGHSEKAGVILLYPVLAQIIGAGLFMPFVWNPLSLSDWQVGI